MNESDICTIIKNSFIANGDFAYKIPDPSSVYTMTIQRPFDIIATFEGKPIYMEVKYMNKLQSFNLSHIQDHQIQALTLLQKKVPTALCCIALGVKVDRGDTRIYIFYDIFEIERRRLNKENYKKKELEAMSYFAVHKNLMELIHHD
jgi:hypothetical protein